MISTMSFTPAALGVTAGAGAGFAGAGMWMTARWSAAAPAADAAVPLALGEAAHHIQALRWGALGCAVLSVGLIGLGLTSALSAAHPAPAPPVDTGPTT